MNPNNEYDDHSALDAPDNLSNVLECFFTQKRNVHKFALAKQHFDNLKRQQDFVDASRFFKVITGTDLITNKHVLQYRTTQGM